MHGQVRPAELKADQGAAAGLPRRTQQHSTAVADAAADPRRAPRFCASAVPRQVNALAAIAALPRQVARFPPAPILIIPAAKGNGYQTRL